MYECLYMLFNVWMQCIGIYADIFNVAELIYYCSILPFSTINENKSFGHFWFIRQTSNLNFCVKFNSGISSFFNLKRKIEMCRQTNTDTSKSMFQFEWINNGCGTNNIWFYISQRDKRGTNQKLSDQHARIIKVSPMIW